MGSGGLAEILPGKFRLHDRLEVGGGLEGAGQEFEDTDDLARSREADPLREASGRPHEGTALAARADDLAWNRDDAKTEIRHASAEFACRGPTRSWEAPERGRA
ncbi:MAG: hypothetical protein CL933_03090 [Deltaproteobacteria bacterium]|nr:hypothetical protein [Deltaproteobacteria bacterium]